MTEMECNRECLSPATAPRAAKPRLSGELRPGITTSVDETCRRALVQALGGHALCGSIA
jgi:hypothetical protein